MFVRACHDAARRRRAILDCAIEQNTTKRTKFYPSPSLDVGKADLQLIADKENQDRAECRKNETGGMISFICRARKHVGNSTADDRSDDAEHDCPQNRHVYVHYRFCNKPRNQPNNNVPD